MIALEHLYQGGVEEIVMKMNCITDERFHWENINDSRVCDLWDLIVQCYTQR